MAEDRGGGGERTVTEREAVLREREAYARALRYSAGHTANTVSGFCSCGICAGAKAAAQSMFRLPPINRRRVVRINRYDYRVVDGGEIQGRAEGDSFWSPLRNEADRVRALADLLANPVETVPDEESE